MAVSKRLRYEVLRRDNHQCRYCGGAAPDVALTVDHVVPTTLGGSDDPSNLVAACKDCNAGKSASSPDATHVANAKEGALRWAAALKRAIAEREDETEADKRVQEWFRKSWESWFSYPSHFNSASEAPEEHRTYHRLDDSWGWKRSIRQFRQSGAMNTDFTIEAIRIAMKKAGLDREARWRYFCGVMWNEIKTRQQIAARYMVRDDPPPAVTSAEAPFDYMLMFDQFLEHLVPALGGDEQVVRYVSGALWNVMPDAHTAWNKALRDPGELGEDETAEDAAIGAASEEVSMAVAYYMRQVQQWREARDNSLHVVVEGSSNGS